MSSKGTIFLTSDNEHCYHETNEMDGFQFRVYLEIDSKNITFLEGDNDGDLKEKIGDYLVIGIKGDSDLSKVIQSATYRGNS